MDCFTDVQCSGTADQYGMLKINRMVGTAQHFQDWQTKCNTVSMPERFFFFQERGDSRHENKKRNNQRKNLRTFFFKRKHHETNLRTSKKTARPRLIKDKEQQRKERKDVGEGKNNETRKPQEKTHEERVEEEGKDKGKMGGWFLLPSI